MQEVKEIFKIIDTMMIACDIDYSELISQKIDNAFFDDYSNVRVVNSFLFNFSKIQDKIGAKLFKKVLYAAKEIDHENIPMKDALNLLEKLGVIENSESWDRLREIRNSLAHEYPFNIEDRVENIILSLEGYQLLKKIYTNLKVFTKDLNLI
ncbi:hypothetical protein RZR97_03655 [Hydrogenimonas thermophila]|uniref:hypothetical protein n=1 Tax=Hydrogenimonas thermophila TaxID=223786 RepID=UPI0029371419|nr:hypothetical protein [Hydrogenimonas thermophila]WOE70674.1 hypothetical protein RZR91_03665 [Hydrogenimonas thermophila]WOE73192.1 hypothetical protein RZR97_03655 [Hydrogenimonas thermophila]